MIRRPGRARRRGSDADSPITPAAEERIWAEVQRRIAMDPAGRPHLEPAPDRRPLVLSLVLVACALAVAGVLATQRSGPGEGVATATSTDESRITMDDLARVARDQPMERVADGEVLLLAIDHVPTASQRAAGVVGRREVHSIADDGRGHTDFASLPDAPGTVEESTQTFDQPGALLVGGLTPDEIGDLSGDLDAVLTALRGVIGAEGDPPPTDLALELLATPLLSGPARAALFHVLDDQGVDVRGPATDHRGRSGLALVARSSTGRTVEAVIDPTTTTLLSLRQETTGLEELDPALAVYVSAHIRPDD